MLPAARRRFPRAERGTPARAPGNRANARFDDTRACAEFRRSGIAETSPSRSHAELRRRRRARRHIRAAIRARMKKAACRTRRARRVGRLVRVGRSRSPARDAVRFPAPRRLPLFDTGAVAALGSPPPGRRPQRTRAGSGSTATRAVRDANVARVAAALAAATTARTLAQQTAVGAHTGERARAAPGGRSRSASAEFDTSAVDARSRWERRDGPGFVF